MTSAARSESAAPSLAGCWCCGGEFTESDLVRLGAHTEVGLCLGCAIWAKRRAVARRHERQPTLVGRLCRGVDLVRAAVVDRGWHRRGRFGALLCRLDRHLP